MLLYWVYAADMESDCVISGNKKTLLNCLYQLKSRGWKWCNRQNQKNKRDVGTYGQSQLVCHKSHNALLIYNFCILDIICGKNKNHIMQHLVWVEFLVEQIQLISHVSSISTKSDSKMCLDLPWRSLIFLLKKTKTTSSVHKIFFPRHFLKFSCFFINLFQCSFSKTCIKTQWWKTRTVILTFTSLSSLMCFQTESAFLQRF